MEMGKKESTMMGVSQIECDMMLLPTNIYYSSAFICLARALIVKAKYYVLYEKGAAWEPNNK